ncbi:MAG: histidinol-phosphate transaminase, partial [Tannerella sp.]|nr:histidinol-phosphate transaminase [Tannerella sp.]
VSLDANENPLNSPFNRYPDPLQEALKTKIAKLKNVRPSQIMLGVGSDEPIDLLIRIFCEPKEDNIVAIDPTYGMYEVCADVNNVEYRKALLNDDFSLNAKRLLDMTDRATKLIFLCSPNNPTGNVMNSDEVTAILNNFKGITVMDEAYIDFTPQPSWLTKLNEYPRLVVLQTFSKAWGLASVRCGMAFASEEIVDYLNKVKYPYNINMLTQKFVGEQLDFEERKNGWVKMLLEQREALKEKLRSIPLTEKIFPSDANFLLVKVADANSIYNKLVEQGIIVRNRNNVSLCCGCLRITVGTARENDILINALKQL